MKSQPIVLYIDRFHLDDRLFVDGLARHIASLALEHPPLILIHGGGSAVEEVLERTGSVPVVEEGIARVETPLEIAVAERAVRHQNQRLAAAMNNAGVSALPVQGADKGFATITPAGEPVLGATTWLESIIATGVVAIVSCLARKADGTVREVPPHRIARHIANRFQAAAILFFTRNNRCGVFFDGASVSEISVEEIPADVFAERAMLEVARGVSPPLFLTNIRGLGPEGQIQGTRVVGPEGHAN